MRSLAASLVVSLSLLVPSAHANTWVVDDTPGPGVDFPSIALAMTVALPGDVFIVRAGNYSGFTLQVGAVILCETGVFVTGDIEVSNVPGGNHAALVNLTAETIRIDQCTGGVLLEDVVARPGTFAPGQTALVSISNSIDVRLRNVDVDLIQRGAAAASVVSSRVEISTSRLIGGAGRSHHAILFPPPPEPGGDGLVISGASDVHVSRTDARGGVGGDLPASFTCACLVAAPGGFGIRVGPAANLLLTGSSTSLIKGGSGGVGQDCPYDGAPGNGIVISSGGSARISGATVSGESPRTFCGGSPVLPVIGAYTVPSSPEPTLRVTGTPLAGAPVTFTLSGTPGATARFSFGRNFAITDVPFVAEDILTTPIRFFDMGVIPPSGEISLTIPLPGYLPRGFLVVAQGRTDSASIGMSLSPSAAITLR
ncbi:MAG: hypothetical protein JNL28_10190 [Planctomycetes bacterium]|nr:hypothetical protein [Planctomycetota bacterium]